MKGTDEVFFHMDAYMKEQGRLEKDLIHYLGLSTGTYSQWRIGHGQSYLRYIKEICEWLHITPTQLILGKDGQETDETPESFYTGRKIGHRIIQESKP